MNGKQIVVLKEALDNVNKELYKELPISYAEKAVGIIQNNISKAIKRLLFE